MQAGNEGGRIDYGRVLYDGWSQRSRMSICVTTRWCIVNGQPYPVAELDLVGLSRGTIDPLRTRRSIVLAIMVVALVLVAVAISRGWTRELWIALAVTAVATVAVTALPSTLGTVLRRPFQIWAQHGGRPVLLFETQDPEQHGQVARALVRAREISTESS